MMTEGTAADGSTRLAVCKGLALAWFLAFFGAMATSGGISAALAGIHTLALILIVVVHGSLLYGWAGLAAYLALGTAIGFGLEASSVANGFPFGSYVHNVGGPKPLGVPIQAILVYVLAGWYAWAIGRAIVLLRPERLDAIGAFGVPIVAAVVLAGLDYPHDPIGATVRGDWTFAYPGGQFGVPITNYLGWIFTGWVLFQLFALIERRFAPSLAPAKAAATRAYWLIPCLIWLAMPLQFLASWRDAPNGTVSLGRSVFVIADIHEASLIGSIFSIALPAFVGIFRMLQAGDPSRRRN